MPQPTKLLDAWTDEQIRSLNRANFVAGHRLHELPLFTDEGLIETISRHPEGALSISTSGQDPAKNEEWRDGVSGGLGAAELLDAVKNGRLWLNLRRVMDHHPEFARLVNDLYDELESIAPGLHTFNRSANLLISSPSTIVYYHIDCPVNMLWHLRGEKRAFVHPLDAGVVSQEIRESVLSGGRTEEIPYTPELDEKAEVFDLKPGQMITWPQHTPHRVENVSGLNVSLSTEHMTREACRVVNVYQANAHFRGLLGGGFRSTELEGLAPALKELAIRIARRVPGLAPKQQDGHVYPQTFVVDPAAPDCIRPLDEAPTEPVAVPVVDAGPLVDVPTGVV